MEASMDKVMNAMVSGKIFEVPSGSDSYNLVYIMSVTRESGINTPCHLWIIGVLSFDKSTKREYFVNSRTGSWVRTAK